ncbi:MAG: hypothetical protein J3R72DRAFT_144261 [Linnemannia gamsii]|nr:MAG: hypothetical protein J3R72DRAFT_144261 [Linnemannia gamsii]
MCQLTTPVHVASHTLLNYMALLPSLILSEKCAMGERRICRFFFSFVTAFALAVCCLLFAVAFVFFFFFFPIDKCHLSTLVPLSLLFPLSLSLSLSLFLCFSVSLFLCLSCFFSFTHSCTSTLTSPLSSYIACIIFFLSSLSLSLSLSPYPPLSRSLPPSPYPHSCISIKHLFFFPSPAIYYTSSNVSFFFLFFFCFSLLRPSPKAHLHILPNCKYPCYLLPATLCSFALCSYLPTLSPSLPHTHTRALLSPHTHTTIASHLASHHTSYRTSSQRCSTDTWTVHGPCLSLSLSLPLRCSTALFFFLSPLLDVTDISNSVFCCYP